VILGLFSGAGGRFILYRPGQPPLDAPQVPIDYQLMKSVGHSTMALGEIVVPYINSPNDKSWRPSMATYRIRMQRRSTASMPRSCGRIGNRTVARFCRTTLRSWTNV
jgi:hypothetical protein